MPKRRNKVTPLWQWPGKKKSLELEEWWFEECPKDELQHCWAYELGRHIHEVVWRYLEDKRNKFKVEGTDVRVNGVWSYCLRLYSNSNQKIPLTQLDIAAPSGFPEKPYLALDRSKLDKETLRVLSSPVRITPFDQANLAKDIFAAQFNWAYSNKQILGGIKNWLEKCDRPKPTKVQGLAPERIHRTNLKALGAYRLIKFCGSVEGAISYVENAKKSPPYAHPNRWYVAKRKAQKQIKDINLQSGFWHPDIELLPKKYFKTTPYWNAYSKANEKGN
ncbi:MAG: hypothetical protein QF732_10240 [Nitrospinaceae bacterium]|nr:hypothetical protein [Nitrospinaceae bacterium]